MTSALEAGMVLVRGRLDAEGRLIEAEPALADLHRRAGGNPGGVLAVPQIAALARLARKLGIVISRGAIAADGEHDLDLWVRAEPVGDSIELSIGGWTERARHGPLAIPTAEREADFVRAAVDWVWETDENLRLTSLSPPAPAAIGRSLTELLGQPLTGLFRFHEHEDGSLPILNALAERRRFEDQLAEIRKGSARKYRLDGVPLIDGTGKFAGFRGSASVVAPLPAVAAANDGAEAPAPTGSAPFGDRIGKALRDPIDHIIMHAETIRAQTEGPLQTDYAGYAADIASAGRHLLSLVDDLVDLQAIERPDFSPAADPIDLAEVARQAAHLLAGRAVEAYVRIDEPGETENLPAIGEFRRALQIVMNLITNAIRYSPQGSNVGIALNRQGEYAALTVSDEGKGIDPADQARIFEKFERVDPMEAGGTGLGLYIARRLARAMGGDLICESRPGEGAKFMLTLPAPIPS